MSESPRVVPPTTGPQASLQVMDLVRHHGFEFVIFEQLPLISDGTKIIRKVAVVPRGYMMPVPRLGPIPAPWVGPLRPADPFGLLPPAEHVLGLDPKTSPFLSASDRSMGAATMRGEPLLIDVAKVRAAGGQILTVEELASQLSRYAADNPSTRMTIEKLINTITQVEGEVLVKGNVPAGAASRITGTAHLGHINSAQALFEDLKAGRIKQEAFEQGIREIEQAYARARIVGRIGRVCTVVAIVVTVIDLGRATDKSVQQGSVKPIAAESLRQIGGWGGAIAGAKIGGVLGAAVGIETGPGAIVTGVIGAIAFGYLGYIGADLIADQISPN